jgi:hypothetical protein
VASRGIGVEIPLPLSVLARSPGWIYFFQAAILPVAARIGGAFSLGLQTGDRLREGESWHDASQPADGCSRSHFPITTYGGNSILIVTRPVIRLSKGGKLPIMWIRLCWTNRFLGSSLNLRPLVFVGSSSFPALNLMYGRRISDRAWPGARHLLGFASGTT